MLVMIQTSSSTNLCYFMQLIGRCGEESTQAKVGECLGELGAIDPGW